MEYLDSVSLKWHWEYAFFMSSPPPCPLTPEKWRKSSFFFFFVYLFIQVELTYNIVLISAEQLSDSVIHVYILFIFFSIIVYHKMLNMVPSAVGQDMLFIHLDIIACIW